MNQAELERKAVKALYRKLIRSKLRRFPAQGEKLDAPDQQGVYVIYDEGGNVAHVGRTPKAKRGISQRLRNHMAGASSFTNAMLDGKGAELRGKYSFRYIVVENQRHRAFLEAYSIGSLCPTHIGLG